MTAPTRTASHFMLAPDIQSIPARMPMKTKDVPRSGCSMTSSHGGPTSTHAPRTVFSESSR